MLQVGDTVTGGGSTYEVISVSDEPTIDGQIKVSLILTFSVAVEDAESTSEFDANNTTSSSSEEVVDNGITSDVLAELEDDEDKE